MRKIFFGLLFIFSAPTLFGQSWIQVPVQLNYYPQCLYADSVDNLIYLGGLFGLNGTDTVRGVATWDNNTISGCAEGINNWSGGLYSGVQLSEIVRFQDKIYIGGGANQFTVGDGIWTRGIGVWDGVVWDSVNVGLLDNWGQPSGVQEMKVIGNILYVGGSFTNINGTIEANGLAKFDGINWSAVHDFPQWDDANVNVVRHIAEYNGEIYVAGQLTDSYPYDTMYNICKYNGSEWVQLGEGIGGTFSTVLDMEVYNGKLFMCGSFNKNDRPQNPANRIVAWNGSSWEEVGDIQGATESSYADVREMAVLNGELYVIGRFEKVSGYPASNFAKFNGTEWCTYPDVFNQFIDQVEVYNNEVYITGLFSDIGGAPISLYAKFDHSAIPANCVSIVGIDNIDAVGIEIYPNPSDDILKIRCTEVEMFNNEIIMYSADGSVVLSLNMQGKNEITISTAEFPSGVYILRVGDVRRRVIIQ